MDRLLSLPGADIEALETLAQKIAARLQAGDVILLTGELGSGKTTFARVLLRALGVTEEVPSPTFTLVQTYEGRSGAAALSLWHFDFYRLESGEEVLELGLDEALETGVSLIEWPEIARDYLPADCLEIRFAHSDNPERRDITVTGGPGWAARGPVA